MLSLISFSCICLLLAPWHCFLTRWCPPLWSASSGAYVDYFGPNKWTNLTLVELGWNQAGSKKHFSYWVWISLWQVLLLKYTRPTLWKTRASDPLPHRWRRGKCTSHYWICLQYFFSRFFFPRTYRGVRLGRKTKDTADTSSTGIFLKNVQCRVASTRQMLFSNVRIDQCKSVTIVLYQLSPHTEKPRGELKALCKQPEGKRYFWW